MVSMKQTTATAHKPQSQSTPTAKRAGTSDKTGPAFIPAHKRNRNKANPDNELLCETCGAFPGDPCLTRYELPSEWLGNLDTHSIYASANLRQSFKRRTGKDAPRWPEYTPEQSNEAIDNRGLGGQYVKATDPLGANGWEIAEAIAYKFAREQAEAQPVPMGRGFRFRAAVDALRKAGL